jgi:hypothetical protein
MITALVLAAVLSSSSPKTDREAPEDCFLAQSFKDDLRKAGGFLLIEAEREVTIRYLASLVTLGIKAPPLDIGTIASMLIITNPQAPDMVLIALIDSDGLICVAANIPRSIHDAVLRGA